MSYESENSAEIKTSDTADGSNFTNFSFSRLRDDQIPYTFYFINL